MLCCANDSYASYCNRIVSLAAHYRLPAVATSPVRSIPQRVV